MLPCLSPRLTAEVQTCRATRRHATQARPLPLHSSQVRQTARPHAGSPARGSGRTLAPVPRPAAACPSVLKRKRSAGMAAGAVCGTRADASRCQAPPWRHPGRDARLAAGQWARPAHGMRQAGNPAWPHITPQRGHGRRAQATQISSCAALSRFCGEESSMQGNRALIPLPQARPAPSPACSRQCWRS